MKYDLAEFMILFKRSNQYHHSLAKWFT